MIIMAVNHILRDITSQYLILNDQSLSGNAQKMHISYDFSAEYN